MHSMLSFSGTMTAMAHALWRQRWTFVGAGVASVGLYHLLLVLFLSDGLAALPTYLKVYNVPYNILTIWRSTPSLVDIVQLVDQEPVFEFGRMTSAFKVDKTVIWNYMVTIHVLGDTILVFLILALYMALVRALHVEAQRRQAATCPKVGRAIGGALLLSLIGAGTGAACCGAISLSLVATILGATTTAVARLARYELLVIVLGYLLLIGGLVHQGYRLYQLLRQTPRSTTRPAVSPQRLGESTAVLPG